MDTAHPEQPPEQLKTLLLALLPEDHSTVGNITLLTQLQAAARDAGLKPIGEDDFKAARDALVTDGQAVKGKGRGGSLARATGANRPDFALKPEEITPDMLIAAAEKASAKNTQPAKAKAAPQAATVGDPQVLAYRHADRRKNNPEVGLVNEASDPEQPKTTYSYDPHLDPVLQWTGKAERTSFEVDTVSLHVHERIDAMSILSAVSKRQGKKGDNSTMAGFQPGLFEAPFESMPLRSAIDFYKHDRGWANRLVAGDSLLVMNSLLQKEGMAGQVQMIYIDPPYGIKYGSNFQPFTNKRDVKDRSDADLTQEPEMIKAFRDTWELGIHSYLTYLRDRLLLAKDLLSETGSVFVQISDENVHLVRNLLDDVFGSNSFVAQIAVRKTTSDGALLLGSTCDYLIWYAKNPAETKYRVIYLPRSDESESRYDQKSNTGRRYRMDNIASSRAAGEGDATEFSWFGQAFNPGKGTFKTTVKGLQRVGLVDRLQVSGKGKLNYR